MPRVFFTYVWGPAGDPAWPLTFATKAARKHAKGSLSEGDFVFTVGTRGEPTEPEFKGRVLAAFQVSDLEVNTQDYDLPRNNIRPEFDSVMRFPFALHPIKVWLITSTANVFSSIVGPLTPNHHFQAQIKIVELDGNASAQLLALTRREVGLISPRTMFGRGRVALKNSKLAPKHEGGFNGAFEAHDIWFVYVLVLRDVRQRELAFKVGYSFSPEDRAVAYNDPIATEVTGLRWEVLIRQPTPSEEAARQVEQTLLARYRKYQLPSNGEIIADVAGLSIVGTLADIMRAS